MVHSVNIAKVLKLLKGSSMEMTIGQLAEQAQVPIDTVRHYERQNLLFPKSRNQSNYRIYDETSLERIQFIKNAQKLGFRLSEIREILCIDHTNRVFMSGLDYAIKKLGEIKNEITLLANKKDKLQAIIDEYDSADNAEVCAFFEYLKANEVMPSSELIFCRHSYLFDVGHWELEGNFKSNGAASVGMTGSVDIFHENNLWYVNRQLILKDKDHTNESVKFVIPSTTTGDTTQDFKASCSVFGDVNGSITFAGEDIFKHYEMPKQKVEGHEYLKRVHTDLYEARGVLSDGNVSIALWDYELTRSDAEAFM